MDVGGEHRDALCSVISRTVRLISTGAPACRRHGARSARSARGARLRQRRQARSAGTWASSRSMTRLRMSPGGSVGHQRAGHLGEQLDQPRRLDHPDRRGRGRPRRQAAGTSYAPPTRRATAPAASCAARSTPGHRQNSTARRRAASPHGPPRPRRRCRCGYGDRSVPPRRRDDQPRVLAGDALVVDHDVAGRPRPTIVCPWQSGCSRVLPRSLTMRTNMRICAAVEGGGIIAGRRMFRTEPFRC